MAEDFFLEQWEDAEKHLSELGVFLLYLSRQLRLHEGEIEGEDPESLHRLAKLCDSRRAEHTDVLQGV
jgi:hypothetical protein